MSAPQFNTNYMDSSTIAGHIPPGTFACNSNSDRNKVLNEPPTNDPKPLEEVSHPTQSAASLKFFATPELLELTLIRLSACDTVRAAQASRSLRATIRGSPTIQRKLFLLADYTTYYANTPRRDTDRRILKINPFVLDYSYFFGPPLERFFLRSEFDKFIEPKDTPELGWLKEAYLTQPPIDSIEIYYAFDQKLWFGRSRRMEEYLEVEREGGVKVKDFVQSVLERQAKGKGERVRDVHVCVKGQWRAVWQHPEYGMDDEPDWDDESTW